MFIGLFLPFFAHQIVVLAKVNHEFGVAHLFAVISNHGMKSTDSIVWSIEEVIAFPIAKRWNGKEFPPKTPDLSYLYR